MKLKIKFFYGGVLPNIESFKISTLIQNIRDEVNGDLDCTVTEYMSYLLRCSLKVKIINPLKGKTLKLFLTLLINENNLKIEIKLGYHALAKILY